MTITLGAVLPPTNSVGMVRGAAAGGTCVSIPGRETLYWLPCATYADPTDAVPALLSDGTEEHPARRARGGPHVFFIASSLRATIYCPTCRARRRQGPVVK